MDELKRLKMARQVAINALEEERETLKYADGSAHSDSIERVRMLNKEISRFDREIEALEEEESFERDSQAAINRAVQIENIKLINQMIAFCFGVSVNEKGMTAERYTLISNELYRALKELEA